MHLRQFSRFSLLLLSLGVLIFTGQSCLRSSNGNTGGVLRSNDIAETWEFKNFVGQDRRRVYTINTVEATKLRIDPENPAIIYLLTKENGIYKTENGGEQWYQLPIAAGLIRDLTFTPGNTQQVYATYNNQIIFSPDGGQTWEAFYTDSQGALITRLGIDWYNPNRMFATTTMGTVLLTEDRGINWRVVYKVRGQIADLAISPADSRIIFITEYGEGIHRTVDGGNEWVNLFSTEEDRPALDAWLTFQRAHPEVTDVRNIALDANDSSILYASTAAGLAVSRNLGDEWQMIQTLITGQQLGDSAPENTLIRNILTVPGSPNILMFTIRNQIHKSIDSGVTWKTIDNFPSAKYISTLSLHPKEFSILYAGTENPPEQKRGIFPTPGQQ